MPSRRMVARWRRTTRRATRRPISARSPRPVSSWWSVSRSSWRRSLAASESFQAPEEISLKPRPKWKGATAAALVLVVGGFFVFYLTIVDPSIFDFYYTETMLIMVIIGGPGSFWSVLAASAVLSALPDLLRFTTDLRMVLYGAVLIAAMLLFPGGVGGWLRRRRMMRWRRSGLAAR